MNRINLTTAFVFCIALGVTASTHAVTLTPVKVAPNIYAFIGEIGARRTLMPHPAAILRIYLQVYDYSSIYTYTSV